MNLSHSERVKWQQEIRTCHQLAYVLLFCKRASLSPCVVVELLVNFMYNGKVTHTKNYCEALITGSRIGKRTNFSNIHI